MSLLVITAGLTGLGIAWSVIRLILWQSVWTRRFARSPDLHHTHQQAVPRLGGVGLVAAFVGLEVLIAFIAPEQRDRTPGRNVIVISSLAMFALGLWDDLRGLGARQKLLCQVLIAAAVCWCGIGIEWFKVPFTGTVIALHGWGTLVTIVWLVGLTNLINLIDGADGLAGGICLMLMVLIAYVGHQAGYFELLAAGMAGALLGFLWFNFPPARIYLGDGGAYFLGFQIGLFSLVNSHKGEVFAALAAPMFALALPILDTSVAIVRRGLYGLPIFRPDRRHLHHQMLRIGFSRRKMVLSFYGVTLVFLLLGFAAIWSRGEWIPGLLGLGVLVLLVCAGNLSFSRTWFDVGRVVGNSLEMRREIRYALSLAHWLELEGEREKRIEDLWADLVFVARKLGFTSVKLVLADGQRFWEQPTGGEPGRSIRQELRGGRVGILELQAPSCKRPGQGSRLSSRSELCDHGRCPCVADLRLFEILSELTAEAWIKAVARRGKEGGGPLCFEPEAVREDEEGGRRRAAVSLAPAPLAEVSPKAPAEGR